MEQRRTGWLTSASIVVLLAGCGSDGSSSPTSSASTSSTTNSTTNSSTVASDTTLTTGAVASPNHAVVTVTGAESIDVNGAGGYCQYFLPGTREGLVYVVSAEEFGLSGWTLQVSGNSPTSVGALLNATSGSYANDAALGNGTINAQADLHHADFDLDLVEMANQDITVHVSGSIDCP